MRIVQVANFVSPTSGGLRTTLRHLAQGYAQQGHDVVQIVPAKTDQRVDHPWGTELQLRAPSLGATGYRILLDVRRVQRELSRLCPDALEVHDRTTLRGLGIWARSNGVPALAVSHERLDCWLNQWLPARLPLASWADRSNAALARSFDTIVCTTRWAADEFRRVAASNLVIVPLGVDHEAFQARFEPAPHADGDDGAVLIMASRLSREKQPEIAVEAVRELARRRVKARLVVAGDGPLRRQLEAASAGLPISWLGFVSSRAELAQLYRAADVALAPGPVETFGLAALEAMACGTPAVVNWRSALPEIIGTGAGRVCAGSGFTFADAVQELLAEPAEPLRRAARQRAETYSWDVTVSGLLAVHRSRLEGQLAA
jgi:alpha-1,6-mannosyltransferase